MVRSLIKLGAFASDRAGAGSLAVRLKDRIEEDRSDMPSPCLSQYHIAIVEDNPDIRPSIRRF